MTSTQEFDFLSCFPCDRLVDDLSEKVDKIPVLLFELVEISLAAAYCIRNDDDWVDVTLISISKNKPLEHIYVWDLTVFITFYICRVSLILRTSSKMWLHYAEMYTV